jgi:hypothetical protein
VKVDTVSDGELLEAIGDNTQDFGEALQVSNSDLVVVLREAAGQKWVSCTLYRD